MGGYFGGRRRVGKPRGRWKGAFWRNNRIFAPDTEVICSSKEERNLEEGNWGGHAPKKG
jgi:hypothetical protein